MAGSIGRKISTFIELGGEQAFRQAMNEAARSVRVLDADMKAVSSEFKTTGDAQQYMADKSALLRSKIEQQEKIVKMLSEAVKASAGQYGEASAKTDGYRIKLSNATAKLFDMRRELETADREAEEFGRDSVKVGRQIERGIGEGAEDAQKSMKGLIEQMQADIGSIKGSATFSVISQVGQTVVSAVQGITNFVTSNRDYRRQLSYLRSAAETAGYDWQEIIKLNNEIGAFTGDMDGAAEATANLMQTGLNMDWLGTAVDMFEGASTLWQQTLKMENLAESFQETIATGEGTGAFAELVERLGGDLEALKAVLGDAETEEEKAKAALAYVSGFGLLQTAEAYKEKNSEMLEAQQAEIELAQAWADLSEELEPIVTEITKSMNFVVDQITDAVERAKKSGLLGLVGPGETGNSDLYDENGNLNPEVAKAWGFSKEETELWNTEKSQKNRESEKAVEEAARSQAKEYADAAIQELDGRKPEINDIIQAAFGPGNEEENRAAAVAMIQAMQPTEEEKTELYNALTSMGIDAAMLFDEAFSTSMDTAAQNAYTSGANAGNMLNSGLNASLSGALDTAVNYASQINAALSSIGAGAMDVPIYGAGYHINGASGGGIPGINFTSQIKLNGRQIAQVVDRYQGRKSSRLG